MDNADAKFGLFQAALDYWLTTDEIKSNMDDASVQRLATIIGSAVATKYPRGSVEMLTGMGEGLTVGAMLWSLVEAEVEAGRPPA